MKRKRTRRKPRRSRSRGASRPSPVSVMMSPDGSPFTGDCACPVCVDMMRKGIPRVTMDADGNLVEVPATDLPPMVEIEIRGTASTWPELAPEPTTLELPAGCVVGDALEYLRSSTRELQCGFPPGGLWGSIDGEPCDDRQVVRRGDAVRVHGQRDPAWTEMAEDLIARPE